MPSPLLATIVGACALSVSSFAVATHAGAEPTPTTDARSVDARPTDRRPDPAVRLSCRATRADAGVVIGCKWTEGPADRVAGYRLLRAVDDHGRTVVYRSRDLSANAYRERVRRGHTYRYAVQYLGADGEVLVTSAVETIRVPAQTTDRG